MTGNPIEHMQMALERAHPGWQVWVVWRAVGGPLWCARPWDESSPALNAGTAEDLGEAIGRAEAEPPG